MALTLPIKYMGFDVPESYHNIDGIFITSIRDSEGKKHYGVRLTVQTWKDSSKEINLGGNEFYITCENEAELTIPSFYGKLKELEQFKNSIDC